MKIVIAFIVLLIGFNGLGQASGNWITIDDKTKKKKSVVKLYKEEGKLYGKIVHLFPREGRGPNPKCDECKDDRKGKPLVGLQIVRGLKWDGSAWKNGTIVDPENGTVYNVKLWVNPKNDGILHVRGFVGPFYRTQQWLRVPEDVTK